MSVIGTLDIVGSLRGFADIHGEPRLTVAGFPPKGPPAMRR
jgi:hypothetical protein